MWCQGPSAFQSRTAGCMRLWIASGGRRHGQAAGERKGGRAGAEGGGERRLRSQWRRCAGVPVSRRCSHGETRLRPCEGPHRGRRLRFGQGGLFEGASACRRVSAGFGRRREWRRRCGLLLRCRRSHPRVCGNCAAHSLIATVRRRSPAPSAPPGSNPSIASSS